MQQLGIKHGRTRTSSIREIKLRKNPKMVTEVKKMGSIEKVRILRVQSMTGILPLTT